VTTNGEGHSRTTRDAADVIAGVISQPAKHNDTDRGAWIDGSVAAGVTSEYAEMLRMVTETIASGRGSRPNSDVHNVTECRAQSATLIGGEPQMRGRRRME